MAATKAGQDDETDEDDDPRVSVVQMQDLVTEKAHDNGEKTDDENAHGQGKFAVADIVQDRGSRDGVDHGPADLVDAVEDSKDLRGPPAEAVSWEDHGTQAQFGTEACHEGRKYSTEEVEEEKAAERIPPPKAEKGRAQEAQGQRRRIAVGAEEDGEEVARILVGAHFFWDPFNANLFCTDFANPCSRLEQEGLFVQLANLSVAGSIDRELKLLCLIFGSHGDFIRGQCLVSGNGMGRRRRMQPMKMTRQPTI